MTGIDLLKAYQRAYCTALEIHRAWEYGDEEELLAQAKVLTSRLTELTDLVGTGWGRSQDLKRHLGCVERFLSEGKRYEAHSDINDLIYADLPALFDELVKIAA